MIKNMILLTTICLLGNMTQGKMTEIQEKKVEKAGITTKTAGQPTGFIFGKSTRETERGISLLDNKDRVFSRIQKDTYCWATRISGLIANTSVPVTERFELSAPGAFKVNSERSSIKSSDDKTRWEIQSYINITKQGIIKHCWIVDNADPIGTHKLTVMVNGFKHKAISFKIVK